MPIKFKPIRTLAPLERLKAKRPRGFRWDRRKNERNSLPVVWNAPTGLVYDLYGDLLRQPHVFAAGAPGSDRDRLRDGFLCGALSFAPDQFRWILLDLTDFGMLRFRELPHTVGYTRSPVTGVEFLRRAVKILDRRLTSISRRFTALWIVLDGYDAFSADQKAVAEPLLRKILSRGRVTNVHLFLTASGGIPRLTKEFRTRIILEGGEYRDERRKSARGAIPPCGDAVIGERIRWWMDQKERG